MADASFIINGNVIDGKAVAAKIREEVAAEVKLLQAQYGQVNS
jgi:5,10-methylene-tetrahydrofolate dehydrogenase/methenyl tetrahydrofolate cyclohydrolase